MKLKLSQWLFVVLGCLTFALTSLMIFLGDLSTHELSQVMLGHGTLDLEAWMGKPTRVLLFSLPASFLMGGLGWCLGQVFEQPILVKIPSPTEAEVSEPTVDAATESERHPSELSDTLALPEASGAAGERVPQELSSQP